MKQISTLLILLIISLPSSAQILAGHPLSISSNIFPDTLINYTCNHLSNSEESYFVDINEDLQNDFEIKAFCKITHQMNNVNNIAIKSLNADSYSRFERVDSVYNNNSGNWMTAQVALPFYYGDTINSISGLWDNNTSYLTYFLSFTGASLYFTDFSDTIDRYIGIKYQSTTETGYGWIRVNCPDPSMCYIKDYSFGTPALGINNLELSRVTVYPNPVNDIITIESNLLNEAVQLQLTDVLGKEIKTRMLTNTKATIDVSDVQEGIYFLILQTSNATATKKIIVHRQ